jgi:hypothetical protein
MIDEFGEYPLLADSGRPGDSLGRVRGFVFRAVRSRERNQSHDCFEADVHTDDWETHFGPLQSSKERTPPRNLFLMTLDQSHLITRASL